MDQAGFEDAEAVPRLLAIWEKYVSEKPRPGLPAPGPLVQRPGHLQRGSSSWTRSRSPRTSSTSTPEREATGFDRRFLMKRVGEGWMIDAVQERLDGWQRIRIVREA